MDNTRSAFGVQERARGRREELLSLPLKGRDYKNTPFSGVTLLNSETLQITN